MKRLLLLLIVLAPATAAAQVPPDAAWRTFETEHFRVTYGPGLEALARRAGERAETAHARLSAELAAAPRGRIELLVTDAVDFSNGSATPVPFNRIIVFARPPVDVPSLAYFDDWIDLVVSHELAHIFHLDATGGLGRVLRTLFGRVPAPWPVFPTLGTPDWSIEGLATYIESRFTGAGRVHGTYHEMVLRTAVLEGALESIDQVSGTSPTWPGGARSYIYGSLFAEYLARTKGPEVHERLVEATARAWIPPFFAFDRVARNAMGQSFTEAFREWQAELEDRYRRVADSIRARGVTATEPMGAGGYLAFHPRVGPGGVVAFAASDGRSTPAHRVLDPATGKVVDVGRRNGIGPAAWFPDGALLTSQLEYQGPYRIFSDLYRLDAGGARRLTHGARLAAPDLAADGRRVVAVEGGGGTNRLVIHDLVTGRTRALADPRPDVHWTFPRWAPDGARIAVGRWTAGAQDIVVIDTLGATLHEVTADRAVDAAPAWSPDGRYVVFSSDRTGIPNLYAYDLNPRAADASGLVSPALHQITNLLTGALFPDVSPDGHWIYFSAYHADGFHIERVPFDPAGWRAPEPAIVASPQDAPAGPLAKAGEGTAGEGTSGGTAAGGTASGDAVAGSGDAETSGASRPYSPFPSLRPRFWLPLVEIGTGNGAFLGAATGATDLVGRHGYHLWLAYQAADGLFDGGFGYRYAGLGNPVLEIEVSRSWDELGISRPADAPDARLLSAEDAVSVTATIVGRRWRRSAALTLGGEGTRERRRLIDAPGYEIEYRGTDFVGVVGAAGFSTVQAYPYSISREDGVSISVSGRRRWDLDPFTTSAGTRIDRSYDEANGQIAAYKGLDLPGFAHHVVAARVSARWRGGVGVSPFAIGGASGTPEELVIGTIGGSRRFLPVRGFTGDALYGTSAWTASLEYRFPLASINRGYRLWPVFLDRLSGAGFLDLGDAWCTADERVDFPWCTAPGEAALASAGAELSLDVGIFHSLPARFRGGIAVPIRGPDAGAVLYFRIGHAF